jgi:hypothetical protein
MKIPRIVTLVLTAVLLTVPFARAENAVLAWNEQLINTVRLSRNPPPLAALKMAAFHAAIFDAVNGITRTHQGWRVNEAAPAGANMDAAIASAGHTVLKALWADEANPHNFDTAFEKSLAAIPEGPAKVAGIAWGRKVAQVILAERARSGVDKPLAGTFSSNEPGKWRETPPQFRPAVMPHLGRVAPFVMTAPDQFRAPPPPAVDSQACADDLAQIARIGGRDGAERTEYQTASTVFWADDLGSCTPPGHWNIIAQDLARRRQLSVPETARLFALLNFASADAGIACWDTKFAYCTWRPETAIREITPALNPRATAHPEFIPLMVTPAFPSYISGHSTFSSAASRLLERYFGTDDIEFTTTSDGLPGAVRTYRKLSECRNEIGMSRLWGGIHVRADDVEGQRCGTNVANWVIDHALRPVR